MKEPERFHWADYVVFFTVMVISLGIGLYHAFTGDKQKKSIEYYLGNRHLWMLPVAMSLTVSMVNSNVLIGVPAEIHSYGATFFWGGVSVFLCYFMTALFIVPLLYPLKLTSIYEYFELRYVGIFGKFNRVLAMLLQFVAQIFTVAVVIFGPAIAMEVATGISVTWLPIIIPAVGIIYTALGGIKAVVYADAFQCVVMMVGMLLAIGLGISKLDSASDVWNLGWDWDRIQPDTDYDPTARLTLYSGLIGGFFTGLSAFGTNQAVIQRALGTKTKQHGQWSYVLSGLIFFVINALGTALGLVLFAYYAHIGCDPLVNGEIRRPDQIMPYFVMEGINYPTVPGFFFAAVLCGSLSTISSSINAVSAIIWEDVLVNMFGKISEFKQSIIRKTVSVIFGGLTIGAAFILEANKDNSTLVSILFSVSGALHGPVLAMFLFAALCPFSNGVGTFIGGLFAVTMTTWMAIGRAGLGIFFQRLPVPVDTCTLPSSNATAMGNSTGPASPMSEDQTDLEWFYSISFWYYTLIAMIVVFVIGTIVSIMTWCCTKRETQKKYLFPIIRNCAGTEDEK